jgi:hypothetical protein
VATGSHNSPTVDEEAPIQNTQQFQKEQKHGRESRNDTKLRLTVLAKDSSNLPDLSRPIGASALRQI